MHPSAQPPTVLVVDDEPRAQNLLRSLLEVEGYRVLCASHGPEALEQARQLPDVVLLDLMMPGMDGFEVCRRLRAEPALALMPVIILTALDDRASRLQGLAAGADDFLSKPFDSAELRARLRSITRLNRYRQLYEQRARFEAAIAHAQFETIHPFGWQRTHRATADRRADGALGAAGRAADVPERLPQAAPGRVLPALVGHPQRRRLGGLGVLLPGRRGCCR